MKKFLFAVLIGGAIAGISGVASAHDNVSVTISSGRPYYAPPVVYGPNYVQARPVYVESHWRERQYWEHRREQERRERAWRERERREHEWRQRQEWRGHDEHGWHHR